jgi:hypothetical protein
MLCRDGLATEANFIFDRIMPPDARQQEVYERAVAPIVDDVMLGYNGSVMAYGQTGAGKTYTLANMEADHVGMIPRALADVFNKAAADVVHSYKVYMSYVQIYMEVIKDLLLPSAEQLAIREDANGVFLSNVHEEKVGILPPHSTNGSGMGSLSMHKHRHRFWPVICTRDASTSLLRSRCELFSSSCQNKKTTAAICIPCSRHYLLYCVVRTACEHQV